MFEARYGSTEYAVEAATLFPKDNQMGRYVRLSFRPTGAPEFGFTYDLERDSSFRFMAAIAFQPISTTLDVSDSSLQDFSEGAYPVATLKLQELRFTFQGIWYADLPAHLGVGFLRSGLGTTCVWGSSFNVLEQAKTFPGVQSIQGHTSWLFAIDVGLGYVVPGTGITMTGNAVLNFHVGESSKDFMTIVMSPASSYRFDGSGISPVYLSLGLLLAL